jgi:hypothetical protein
VVQQLVSALATALLASDDVLGTSIVLTLSHLSHHPDNVAALTAAGLLRCLPSLLAQPFPHPAVPVTVELLWNLLEHAPLVSKRGGAARFPY